MRITLKATIAIMLSLGVLLIAAVAGASTKAPTPVDPVGAAEHGTRAADAATGAPSDARDGSTAMCIEGAEDCNDVIVDPAPGDGGSVPGWDGSGEPPSTGSGGGGVVDPGEPVPCGEEVVSGTGPDGTVSYTPCPANEPPPEPTPTVIEPQPGMADIYARPFDTATLGDDGRTVTIDFTTGVEPCYVLDHVDVRYGDKTVTITLFEGHDPTAGEVACIDIAMFARTIVTLDEPLGDRVIVDGGLQDTAA